MTSKRIGSLLVATMLAFTVLGGAFVGSVTATHGDTTGTVTDAVDGTQLEGAEVKALNTTSGAVVANATTDVNGSYSLHLDDGDYDFVVTYGDHRDGERVVTVNGTTVEDFALNPELYNASHAVTNSTTGAYVELTNTTGTVVVDFYGETNGTETKIDSAKIIAGPGETLMYDTNVNADAHENITVYAYGEDADLIDSGLLGILSSGGGAGFFGSEIFGFPSWMVLLAAVVVGGYVLTEE